MIKFTIYPVLLLATLFFTSSCGVKKEEMVSQSVIWEDRIADLSQENSLVSGSTYLSTYAEIYKYSEDEYEALTATISIRNINKQGRVFIQNIEYFNTHGVRIKSYIAQSIYIEPMETLEIVINQLDTEGGTGANFVFDWSIKPGTNDPLFEGVMVSNSGNQGFAFVTHGRKIE
tara:strand:- start:8298 stop:8819 length:522 start_codon:yes stop_codon:yes gene_type:complete